MVGYTQRQAEQADDRTDQPLGLPVGEAEHGAQGQCRQDRQGRIPGLPAPGGARLRRPRFDRLGGEPDRQAPALAQAGVVLAPVRYPVSLARDMVATVLVQLKGTAGIQGSGEGALSYATQLLSTNRPIHAPRWPPGLSAATGPVRSTSRVLDGLCAGARARDPLLLRRR